MAKTSMIQAFILIASYILLIRPLRNGIGASLETSLYLPFGMWYFGALIGFVLLKQDDSIPTKVFVLRLTAAELSLFALFVGLHNLTPLNLSPENMSLAHMILALGLLFSNLKSVS